MENSVELPFAGWCRPFDSMIGNFVGEIELLVFIRICYQTLQLALRKLRFELFTVRDVETFEDHFGRGDVWRDVRSAKRPACPGGEIEAEAEAFAFSRCVGEHLHPFRR